MNEHHKQARAEFLSAISDPYYQKRESAIQWLRASNRYALDRHSRAYCPANGHTPQPMVQLRTRL